jgi:hypothetical protein
MAYTEVQQDRSAIYLEDDEGNQVPKYKIVATVIDAGDLPTPALFVIKVIDPDTPKSDEFARVARIADFDAIGLDRPEAIENTDDDDDILFRTPTFTFYYDNLDTANSAQEVLKSRLDELVDDWRLYDEEFVATTEVTEHPRATTDAFNSLVDAYSSAVTAEATAKDTMDDAKDDYDEAVTDAADAAAEVTSTKSIWDDCVQALGWFDNLYNAFIAPGFVGKAGTFGAQATTFLAAAQTFLSQCTGDPPTTGQKDVFNTAISTFGTQKNTFDPQEINAANAALATAATNRTSFATMCGTKETAYNNAKTAKETADTAVATKRTSYEDAKAAYESAQQATEAALAAVKALKPDWDPATDLT